MSKLSFVGGFASKFIYLFIVYSISMYNLFHKFRNEVKSNQIYDCYYFLIPSHRKFPKEKSSWSTEATSNEIECFGNFIEKGIKKDKKRRRIGRRRRSVLCRGKVEREKCRSISFPFNTGKRIVTRFVQINDHWRDR